jgi:hypothetical protein
LKIDAAQLLAVSESEESFGKQRLVKAWWREGALLMVAHNGTKESVMYNPTEWLGLSVHWVDGIRDVCELDVAALSPFLNLEELNVNVPKTLSWSILVYPCGWQPCYLRSVMFVP